MIVVILKDLKERPDLVGKVQVAFKKAGNQRGKGKGTRLRRKLAPTLGIT